MTLWSPHTLVFMCQHIQVRTNSERMHSMCFLPRIEHDSVYCFHMLLGDSCIVPDSLIQIQCLSSYNSINILK